MRTPTREEWGWVPVPGRGQAPGPASLPDAGKCDSNTDATCFPERASCSKAEGIQCDFLWRRGEQLIKVRTVAVPPTISSVECQVNCK